MACLQLVNNAEAQKKMQKEIDDVIGDRVKIKDQTSQRSKIGSFQRIRFDDNKQLHYLGAFLQEVFIQSLFNN